MLLDRCQYSLKPNESNHLIKWSLVAVIHLLLLHLLSFAYVYVFNLFSMSNPISVWFICISIFLSLFVFTSNSNYNLLCKQKFVYRIPYCKLLLCDAIPISIIFSLFSVNTSNSYELEHKQKIGKKCKHCVLTENS